MEGERGAVTGGDRSPGQLSLDYGWRYLALHWVVPGTGEIDPRKKCKFRASFKISKNLSDTPSKLKGTLNVLRGALPGRQRKLVGSLPRHGSS